jgi:signal transduction histidine kinase
MSQSSPAHAHPHGAPPAADQPTSDRLRPDQPGPGLASGPGRRARPGLLARPRLALENWRVSTRLIALIAVPTAMGLAFAGIQVSMAERNAQTMGRVERLAVLGQQITGLAQAMEDERDETAGFIAHNRPAAGKPVLTRQYAVTNRWAARVRPLIHQLGHGFLAQTLANAGAVLTSINELPALRQDAVEGIADGLSTIDAYTAALANLFSFNDGIAQQTGNAAFANDVRTLSALSQLKDQASQQRAILYTAFVAGQFTPADQTELVAAQAQQATQLQAFDASATALQSELLSHVVAGPMTNQAESLEQSTVADAANGTALNLLPGTSHDWYTDMSDTIGRMRRVEQDLAGQTVGSARALHSNAERTVLETGGLALLALLLVLLITVLIARSMLGPLRRLKEGALDIAETGLPAEVRELTDALDTGRPLLVRPIDVLSDDEIGQVARAFDQVHREAVRLAGEEARLRSSVSAMFVSLSRRSQSLLERLLRLIDSLELGEEDPERLSNLFRMDHLATRMRRNSENLLMLAGHEAPRRWAEPVPLVDVLRAASSEIEQYERVVLEVQPDVAVIGAGVADTVHLLAELLENATTFSAKTTKVIASGHRLTSGGAVIEITDHGMGIPGQVLAGLNGRLANPPIADVAVSRHMGLFAVAHLAARHNIQVELHAPANGGTVAQVRLPASLTSREAAAAGGRPRAGAGLRMAAPRGPQYVPSRFASGPVLDPPLLTAALDQATLNHATLNHATLNHATLTASSAGTGPMSLATGPNVIIPSADGLAPGSGLPIYESLESDWFRARGRGMPRRDAAWAGAPAGGAPAAEPPRTWTSPGDDGWRAAAAITTPATGGTTAAGLPKRVPQANLVPGSASDQSRTATMAEAAEIARSRLANFQRGSRRARASARQLTPGD